MNRKEAEKLAKEIYGAHLLEPALFQQIIADAIEEAYSAALKDFKADEHEIAYEAGYDKGLEDGHKSQYAFDSGYERGKRDGFRDYQEQSAQTAQNSSVLHWALGLAGETGEAIEIIKKEQFKPGYQFDVTRLEEELGDILWYLTQIASAYNLNLEQIAQKNIEKLKARYTKP